MIIDNPIILDHIVMVWAIKKTVKIQNNVKTYIFLKHADIFYAINK